jgi:hypothetical protein
MMIRVLQSSIAIFYIFSSSLTPECSPTGSKISLAAMDNIRNAFIWFHSAKVLRGEEESTELTHLNTTSLLSGQ